MCGRYTLATPAELIGEHFDLPEVPRLEPRFNIAPSQETLVIGSRRDRPRAPGIARWGLESVRPASAPSRRLINARIETVDQKPTFSSAVARRRCLVPADGFYEWRRDDDGKQPVYFSLADLQPFAFAGIWNPPVSEDHLVTFAILTTTPNATVEPIHSRMPVIVHPDEYGRWLEKRPLTRDELESFAVPYSGVEMASWPVSREVNSPAHEGPSLIQPMRDS